MNKGRVYLCRTYIYNTASISTQLHSYLSDSMAKRLSSPSDYHGLLDKYDTWLFDCDGVLWQGDRLIEGVPEVLSLLRRSGASHTIGLQTARSQTIPCALRRRCDTITARYATPIVAARQEDLLRDEQCDQVAEELQEEV